MISANQEKLPDPVVPLGLAYLSASLKGKGHEPFCLDLCFSENIEESLRGAILAFHPQAIGLSLRNVDNVAFPQTTSYLPFFREVIQYCRRFTAVPIVLGGAGFTLMPRAILDDLGADAGIAGEGEELFPQILEAGIGAIKVDGLVVPGSANFIPAARIEDFDSLPPPDWDGIQLTEYFQRGGMGNLQTKRGCPFGCIYCTYPLIEGKSIRLRSPGKVAAEAETLVRQGIENVFIVDNIFNFPETHAEDVCRALIEKELPIQWSCYAHPTFFSPFLAESMKRAGCTGVEFGIDSGSLPVLEKLGKQFSPEGIRLATRFAREAGLEVCHSLSLGAPGETEATLQETFALMEEIAPTAVIAMLGLRIFPGTGLADLAEKEGLLPPDPDFLAPTFYLAPGVKEQLLEWAPKVAGMHPNSIFPGLGINVSPRLQAKLRKIGIKGPLWEHMKILRGWPVIKRGLHAR
ncbi:MAG: radical SAM protein [Deltaproteobacteria bacterium]|nr:radical SAM protein [Deltaproteobacteria bacterium]